MDCFGLKCIKNKIDGLAREQQVKKILENHYGKENVLSERLLRDINGVKVVEPLSGTGRRIDFIVIGKNGIGQAIEVTSITANKDPQIFKEKVIRELGGKYIKHPKTKEIIEVGNISKIWRIK